MGGTHGLARLYAQVDNGNKARPGARARKLKGESDNCLAIAIREPDADVAAMLIDEAARLARRVRELTADLGDDRR